MTRIAPPRPRHPGIRRRPGESLASLSRRIDEEARRLVAEAERQATTTSTTSDVAAPQQAEGDPDGR